MPTIPGMPAGLAECPPAPFSPDDPDRHEKRRAWLAWRDAVAADNLAWRDFLRRHPQHRAQELETCAARFSYWLTRWATIFEPRPGRRGGGGKPFIPFGRQVELADFVFACLAVDDDGELADGVVSKCRDVGASWLMVSIAAWGWLFRSPWNVLFISRTQDLVDGKSQKTLFWKLDYLMKHLPPWMLPAGYDPTKKPSPWRSDLMLANLVSGAQIGGSSTTTDAARGDRVTWALFDEAAKIRDFLYSWSTAGESTDHRFAVSTESLEESADFYNLHSSKDAETHPAFFPIDWWHNPNLDDVWFEQRKRRYAAKPEIFAAEVLRNPFAGGSSWVYEEALAKSPEPIAFVPGAPLYVGIDPGFRNETAIVWLSDNPQTGTIDILDAYMDRGKVAEFYAPLLAGRLDLLTDEHGPEAVRLTQWAATLPTPTYYGDTYGFNQTGASYDSFYSSLANHGVVIVRDRLPDGKIAQSRKEARTFRGRREATKEMMPRLRFGDSPGGSMVWEAFRQHRYRPEERPVVAEAKTPLHDWTSHPVSAVEFVCVNLKLSRAIVDWGLRPASRPNRLSGDPRLRRLLTGRAA